MSLAIKHLNSDASFLLTFQPILPFPPSPGQSTQTFTIVLDPWLYGSSKIWHPKFSISTQKTPPCISSLKDLPEPDLVVVSQNKTDHCHAPTLKELPGNRGKTLIFAEPGAAKTIKSWKHFDPSKVIALQRYEEIRYRKSLSVQRIYLPRLSPNGSPGEVTISFLAQRHDMTGLHGAIGITYHPPTTTQPLLENLPLSPPASPRSISSSLSPSVTDRALSVIFSPHGCTYKTLQPYITSHLISEAALPLTALLHCFDRISNPWYLGGNICAGLPGGCEIAQNLCAKAWISAHDGDKETTGVATKKIVTEKFEREVVESIVSPRSLKFPERKMGTEAVVLDVGEEIRLTQAMWLGPESESEDGNRFGII